MAHLGQVVAAQMAADKAARAKACENVRSLLMRGNLTAARDLLETQCEALRLEGYVVAESHSQRLIDDCPLDGAEEALSPECQMISWLLAIRLGENPLAPRAAVVGPWRFGLIYSSEPGWWGYHSSPDIVILTDHQFPVLYYSSTGGRMSTTGHRTAICWRGPIPAGLVVGQGAELPSGKHKLVEISASQMGGELNASDAMLLRRSRFWPGEEGMVRADGALIMALVGGVV